MMLWRFFFIERGLAAGLPRLTDAEWVYTKQGSESPGRQKASLEESGLLKSKLYQKQMQKRDMLEEELKKFYEARGAKIDAYVGVNAEGVRGLFASRDIDADEVFVRIPLTLAYQCGALNDWECATHMFF